MQGFRSLTFETDRFLEYNILLSILVCCVDQAGLELNKDPSTVSKVLGLKMCVLNSNTVEGGNALFLNQLKYGEKNLGLIVQALADKILAMWQVPGQVGYCMISYFKIINPTRSIGTYLLLLRLKLSIDLDSVQ